MKGRGERRIDERGNGHVAMEDKAHPAFDVDASGFPIPGKVVRHYRRQMRIS